MVDRLPVLSSRIFRKYPCAVVYIYIKISINTNAKTSPAIQTSILHPHALKLIPGDDDVIQEPDSEHFPGFNDLTGYGEVRIARLGNTRRMVMGKNQRRRRKFESRSEHFARMNDVRGQCSDRNEFVMDKLIVAIEIEATKMLLRQIAHVFQIFINLARGPDNYWLASVRSFKQSPTEFEAGNELARFHE